MTTNPTDTGRKMVPYRKKPVVISALQWFKHGDHAKVRKTEVNFGLSWRCEHCGDPQETHGVIITLESGAFAHTVCPGDWIICGVKGEFYACKPDIFAATYEAAAPTDTVPAAEAQIQAEALAQLLGAAILRLKELGEKSWELPPYAKRLASHAEREGREPIHETGWQCPSCRRCYAPGHWQCEFCVPSLKERVKGGNCDNG